MTQLRVSAVRAEATGVSVAEARRQRRRRASSMRHLRQERTQETGRWRRICERDDWICWRCAEPIDEWRRNPDPKSGTSDHVVMLVDGGGEEDSNLRAAHLGCNSSRNRSRTVELR